MTELAANLLKCIGVLSLIPLFLWAEPGEIRLGTSQLKVKLTELNKVEVEFLWPEICSDSKIRLNREEQPPFEKLEIRPSQQCLAALDGTEEASSLKLVKMKKTYTLKTGGIFIIGGLATKATSKEGLGHSRHPRLQLEPTLDTNSTSVGSSSSGKVQYVEVAVADYLKSVAEKNPEDLAAAKAAIAQKFKIRSGAKVNAFNDYLYDKDNGLLRAVVDSVTTESGNSKGKPLSRRRQLQLDDLREQLVVHARSLAEVHFDGDGNANLSSDLTPYLADLERLVPALKGLSKRNHITFNRPLNLDLNGSLTRSAVSTIKFNHDVEKSSMGYGLTYTSCNQNDAWSLGASSAGGSVGGANICSPYKEVGAYASLMALKDERSQTELTFQFTLQKDLLVITPIGGQLLANPWPNALEFSTRLKF